MTAPETSRQRVAVELGIVLAILFPGRELLASLGLHAAGPIVIVIALIVATLFLRREGSSWREVGLRLPSTGKGWVALAALTLLALAASLGLASAVTPLLLPEGGPDVSAFDALKGNLIAFLLVLVFIAWGTAAFGEEMLARGFLITRIETLFGGGRTALWSAVVLQAVIFGLAHSYQGLYGIVLTGLVGLVMGVVYVLGKRWLLPVILAHGLIDTISLTQLYLS